MNQWYSLYVAREYLRGSYVISADYYYFENPFNQVESHSFYETVPYGTPGTVRGVTSDSSGRITSTNVPAERNQWMMYGISYFDEEFGEKFRRYLEAAALSPEKAGYYWEQIYAEHVDELALYEKRTDVSNLVELDTPEELEQFDPGWREYNSWMQ